MGWEYHNRERGKNGRFASTERYAQLHLWCTALEKETIRGRAHARHMSMSEYLLDLVRRDIFRTEYGITVEGK